MPSHLLSDSGSSAPRHGAMMSLAAWRNPLFAALACLALCSSHGLAQNAAAGNPAANWTGPKMRLAVMDINGSALRMQTVYAPPTASSTTSVSIPPPADFARGMTELLTTSLIKTDRFIVLERAAMDKLQAEQTLGASTRVNKETGAKEGQMIGAQAIVLGDITMYSYTQSSYGGNFSLLKGVTGKLDKLTAEVGLDIRIVDAVTGQVLASKHAAGKASSSGASTNVTQSKQSFALAAAHNTPLGQATAQALQGAVDAIVEGMKKQHWSARAIDFREDELYINAGTEMGIKPGIEFDVYRPQAVLLDPDTGVSLGAPERKVGSVTVDSVEEKYCVAKVTTGSDMRRGDVIRLKGDTARP